MNPRERWARLVEMAESKDPEVLGRLSAYLIQRQIERRQRLQRKPGLFLVPKPVPKPEQLDLDFTSEDQRELERAMSDILERQRKPKVRA
jgi:hypothetical protein